MRFFRFGARDSRFYCGFTRIDAVGRLAFSVLFLLRFFRFGARDSRFYCGFTRIARLTRQRLGLSLFFRLTLARQRFTRLALGNDGGVIGRVARVNVNLCRFLRLHARQRCGDFILFAGANLTLRLRMTRFTGQFFPFQTRLTRFKARFRFGGAFRFQIDSAQFRLLLAVILHQWNITGANPGAGAAFDAIVNMVSARLVVIGALAVPVELLRQQIGRAGVGAGAATDAGKLLLRFAHLAGRRRQQTVGDFHHRHIQRWQGKAH